MLRFDWLIFLNVSPYVIFGQLPSRRFCDTQGSGKLKEVLVKLNTLYVIKAQYNSFTVYTL